eukprot:g5261.t1
MLFRIDYISSWVILTAIACSVSSSGAVTEWQCNSNSVQFGAFTLSDNCILSNTGVTITKPTSIYGNNVVVPTIDGTYINTRIFTVETNSTLTLRTVNITGGKNVACGGGIYLQNNTALQAYQTIFFKNVAKKRGGAIYAVGSTTIYLENVIISENSVVGVNNVTDVSQGGGGIFIEEGTANKNRFNAFPPTLYIFNYSLISDNHVGMHSNGGAIHSINGNIILKNLQIKNHNKGSGVYAVGGSLQIEESVIEANGQAKQDEKFYFTKAEIENKTVLDLDFEDKFDKSGRGNNLVHTDLDLFNNDENQYWSEKLSGTRAKDKCKSYFHDFSKGGYGAIDAGTYKNNYSDVALKRKGVSYVGASTNFVFNPNVHFTIETWVYIQPKVKTDWSKDDPCTVQDEFGMIFSMGCEYSTGKTFSLLTYDRCGAGADNGRWFEVREKSSTTGKEMSTVILSTKVGVTDSMPIEERWYHLALVREDSSLILFVDGVPTVSNVSNDKAFGSDELKLYLGAYDANCPAMPEIVVLENGGAVKNCAGNNENYRSLSYDECCKYAHSVGKDCIRGTSNKWDIGQGCILSPWTSVYNWHDESYTGEINEWENKPEGPSETVCAYSNSLHVAEHALNGYLDNFRIVNGLALYNVANPPLFSGSGIHYIGNSCESSRYGVDEEANGQKFSLTINNSLIHRNHGNIAGGGVHIYGVAQVKIHSSYIEKNNASIVTNSDVFVESDNDTNTQKLPSLSLVNVKSSTQSIISTKTTIKNLVSGGSCECSRADGFDSNTCTDASSTDNYLSKRCELLNQIPCAFDEYSLIETLETKWSNNMCLKCSNYLSPLVTTQSCGTRNACFLNEYVVIPSYPSIDSVRGIRYVKTECKTCLGNTINKAGDDPNLRQNTTCQNVSTCQINEHVYLHAVENKYKCKACDGNTVNNAGDDPNLKQNTTCQNVSICQLNEHVYLHAVENKYKCKACEGNTVNNAGDNPNLRQNTTCQNVPICQSNEHIYLDTVTNKYKCKACDGNTVNNAGDDPNLRQNTTCQNVPICQINEYVYLDAVENKYKCKACDGNTVNNAGDDPNLRQNTTCQQVPICQLNEHVYLNAAANKYKCKACEGNT